MRTEPPGAGRPRRGSAQDGLFIVGLVGFAVASAVGGIPDYITPRKNGFLFPPTDLPEFVRNIQLACSHPLFSRGSVELAAHSALVCFSMSRSNPRARK